MSSKPDISIQKYQRNQEIKKKEIAKLHLYKCVVCDLIHEKILVQCGGKKPWQRSENFHDPILHWRRRDRRVKTCHDAASENWDHQCEWVSWAEPRVYSWELREEELSLIICWANGWDLLGCPSRVEANASNEKRASLISPTATQHWAQYHYIHRVCRWWLSRSSHQHGNNGRTIILSLDLWISHSLFSSLPVYRIFSK